MGLVAFSPCTEVRRVLRAASVGVGIETETETETEIEFGIEIEAVLKVLEVGRRRREESLHGSSGGS